MSRIKHARSYFSDRPLVPFISGEQAWLWYARCQTMRYAGARVVADQGSQARPCDPDDIYRTLSRLHRDGRLRKTHLRVLGKYGIRECAPDPRLREQKSDFTLWSQALCELERCLVEKKIVERLRPCRSN